MEPLHPKSSFYYTPQRPRTGALLSDANIIQCLSPDDPNMPQGWQSWRPGPHDFAPKEYHAGHALLKLTLYYHANPQFMSELAGIHSQHTDAVHFIKTEGRSLNFPLFITVSDGHDVGLVSSHPKLMDLVMCANTFRNQWGLRAPWALRLLLLNLAYGHQCESDSGVEVWRPRFFALPFVMFWESIDEEIAPPGKWYPMSESRQDYLNRVKEYLDAVEKRILESGMKSQCGKSELDTHVGWLYERIALRLTPTQIWDRQRDRLHAAELPAIEKGITRVAKLLAIQLPRNKSRYER
jgi:hypothetical protein